MDGQDLYNRLAIKRSVMWQIRQIFLVSDNEFWELDLRPLMIASQKDCDQRLEELLRIFDFFRATAMKLIESFSHGMRQRSSSLQPLVESDLGLGRTDDRFGPTGFLRFKTNDEPACGSGQDGYFLYPS